MEKARGCNRIGGLQYRLLCRPLGEEKRDAKFYTGRSSELLLSFAVTIVIA